MDDDGELRPAYRTLDDPARFLGVALSGWAALAVAAGLGYGWLLLSPLGWRASVSVAVVLLGGPAGLLVLREQSTIGPGRLLMAVVRWRLRPATVLAPSEVRPVRGGAVRLNAPATPAPEHEFALGAPWPDEVSEPPMGAS